MLKGLWWSQSTTETTILSRRLYLNPFFTRTQFLGLLLMSESNSTLFKSLSRGGVEKGKESHNQKKVMATKNKTSSSVNTKIKVLSATEFISRVSIAAI